MSNFNNLNTRNLTPQQQRLITMYINQYNQTNSHIDILLDMLDEIRGNILNIINITQPRRHRINRHTRHPNSIINRFINQIFNDRQNNFVYYDYENPINRNVYNDFYMNDSRRNNMYDMSYNNINTNQNYIQNNDLTTFFANFLNTPVTVRPTNEQIQNASRIIRYGDIPNPLSDACPISLDEFTDDDQVRQLLHCGHIFHQHQFQEWFEGNVRCPVCRYDIRTYRPLSRRNTPNNQQQTNITTTPTTTTATTTANNNNTPISNEDTQHLPNTPIDETQTVSNVNIIRDPSSNQIDHVTFDIIDPQFTNNFLDRFARNIFQSLLNPNTQNNNDRFMIDPSNNILFYETILRPNSNSNSSNNT